MYRKDRAKGGGGLMAYISTELPTERVKLPRQYKFIEVLAVKVSINNSDVLFVGVYRPPKAVGMNYFDKLEGELNSLFLWATMDCNTIVLTGNLNLDRLKPEQREGRLLQNLEDVYELECLIRGS